MKLHFIQVSHRIDTRPAATGAPSQQNPSMDAIELDLLLSEVTLMHTRAELFWRFLRRRLNRPSGKGKISTAKGQEEDKEQTKNQKEDEETQLLMESEGIEFENEEKRQEHVEKVRREREERARKLDTVLNRSGLSMKMQVDDGEEREE